jgi:hypothetical protein
MTMPSPRRFSGKSERNSPEASGRLQLMWNRKRLFYTGGFGTTENLLQFMAGTLPQAVPKLINLSPTLVEALAEIERTLQNMHHREHRHLFDHAASTVVMPAGRASWQAGVVLRRPPPA